MKEYKKSYWEYKIPGIYLEFSWAHWRPERSWLKNGVAHGPQTWPWWLLFSWSYVTCEPIKKPNWAKRLWVYTRWGALYFDFYVDHGVNNGN